MNRFILPLLILSLLIFSCNRKANKVVTVQPAAPTQPVVKPKQEVKPAIFPEEEREEVDRMSEMQSRAGKARAREMAQQKDRIKTTGEQETVAELRKTPCYDDCPDFTLKIMTDNSLRFFGRNNVELIGDFEGKLSFSAMLRLSTIAAAQRFYNMDASYPKNADDIPADNGSTITSITWRGRSNKVTHHAGGPKGLLEIEDFMMGLIEQAIWTPIEPKPANTGQ